MHPNLTPHSHYVYGVAVAVGTTVVSNMAGWRTGAAIAIVPLALYVALRADLATLVVLPLAGSALGTGIWLGPVNLDQALMLFATSALGLRLVVRRTGVSQPKLLGVGRGLIVLAVASTIAGVSNQADLLSGTIRFISYAVLLAAIRMMSGEQARHARRYCLWVGAVLASSVLLSSIGLVSINTYLDAETNVMRLGGLAGHPNFAAYTLGPAILWLLVRDAPTLGKRRNELILLLVLLGGFLMTGARGALASLVVAHVVGVLVDSRRRARRLAAVVAASIVGALAVPSAAARISALVSSGGVVHGANSAGWRLDKWRAVMDYLPSALPWGVGWNRSPELFRDGLGVHNGYLEVIFELGLVGAAGAAILLYSLLPRRLDRFQLALFTFVCLITVGDPGLFYPSVMYSMILLLAGRMMIPDELPRPPKVNQVGRAVDFNMRLPRQYPASRGRPGMPVRSPKGLRS